MSIFYIKIFLLIYKRKITIGENMSSNYSFAFGSYMNNSLYEIDLTTQNAENETTQNSQTQVSSTTPYSNYSNYYNYSNQTGVDYMNSGSSIFDAYKNATSNFNIDYSQPYRDILDDMYETWGNMANDDSVSAATQGNTAASESAQAAMSSAEAAQAALENVQNTATEVQEALDAGNEEEAKELATQALQEAQKAQEEADAAQEEADAAKEAAEQAAQAAQEAVGTQAEEECARLAQEAQSVADTAQQAAQKAQEIADRAMEIATEAAQKAEVDPSVVTEEEDDDGNTDDGEDDGNVETETGMENLTDEEKILVNDAVESILDATTRYMSGPFRIGTDEDMLIEILGNEALTPELMQVVQAELKNKGHDIFELIRSETSGGTEDILEGMLLAKLGGKTKESKTSVESYEQYYNLDKSSAEYQNYIRSCVSLFKQAVDGLGTDEKLLAYIMSLPDDMLNDVANMYNEKYGTEVNFMERGKKEVSGVLREQFWGSDV